MKLNRFEMKMLESRLEKQERKNLLVKTIKKHKWKFMGYPLILGLSALIFTFGIRSLKELSYKTHLRVQFEQQIAGEDGYIDVEKELIPVLRQIGYEGILKKSCGVWVTGKRDFGEAYTAGRGQIILIPKHKVEKYLN